MRFKFLDKISVQNRILYRAEEIADQIIKKQDEYAQKTDIELKEMTDFFIQHLGNGKLIDEILVDAFCVIREMFKRVHGLFAYKCQLIGALIVHSGDFAEMMTGEGKTLTLVLAAYLNALYKKGVHIVTVNEYLVQRDAEFAGEVLQKLGLTCGYITASMSQNDKRQNYNCDVTYVSNSELGFDYLRDNMVKRKEDKVQRELFFAIVDEADSVLIDEARTPLIIAGQPNEDVSNYIKVDNFVKKLNEEDYVVDLESHSIGLSEIGVEKAQEFFKIQNIYDLEFSELIHKITNALRANYIFNNGVEYIVRKNQKTHKDEIVLVDSFTGRIMEGRTYNAGLHQAIQAKEMVEIEPENIIVATITYQSLFRLYHKLSGVSGTAYTEAEELLNIYNMVVVQIPTNKPVIRVDYPDYIFDTKKIKWKYVVAEIKKRAKTQQPILIGTGSVEDSEILHYLLNRVGIKHTLLNAKNHAQEAEIIKHAGEKGNITIATYMAGRGTDIKLGPGVKELGGLYVIGTERNESRRIDNQLRGRSGRQGDPGESRFFISLQDTLFKRFAGDRFQKANDKISEDVIDTKFFSRLLNNTQKRIEGLNYDTRKSLIDYDYILSNQRELFYKQRDKILVTEDLTYILFKMYVYIIEDIVKNNLNVINKDTVDLEPMIKEFNDTVFYKNYLSIDEFNTNNVNYVYDFLDKKFNEYIQEKINQSSDIKFFNDKIKLIILDAMDQNWSWFLDKVSKSRDSVNLRVYEQKSPLNIYISDVDRLFKKLISKIAFQVIINLGNDNFLNIPENNFVIDLNQPNQNNELLEQEQAKEAKIKEDLEAIANNLQLNSNQNKNLSSRLYNESNKKFIVRLANCEDTVFDGWNEIFLDSELDESFFYEE